MVRERDNTKESRDVGAVVCRTQVTPAKTGRPKRGKWGGPRSRAPRMGPDKLQSINSARAKTRWLQV